MLLSLIKRLLRGKERTLKDTRASIQASRVNNQLIVYRYGGIQFWYDLNLGLCQFCMTTNAEVRAYNGVLALLKVEGKFFKSGPLVYYKQGDKLYKSSEWRDPHEH